jgi:hypothetical protein
VSYEEAQARRRHTHPHTERTNTDYSRRSCYYQGMHTYITAVLMSNFSYLPPLTTYDDLFALYSAQ